MLVLQLCDYQGIQTSIVKKPYFCDFSAGMSIPSGFVHVYFFTLFAPGIYDTSYLNRGSYMSAHVLLNLLNELGKRDKMRGLPSILSLFRNEFNKFNNTRTRMLDSIYHMTNTLKSHFWR